MQLPSGAAPGQAQVLEGLLVALFCGTLIGVEREMGKAESARGEPPSEEAAAVNPAGIRTHVLVALLGGLAMVADLALGTQPALAVTGLLVSGLAVVTTYGIRAVKTRSFGTTSVFTLLLTYVLGLIAQTRLLPVAATVAVATTGILALKIPLHRFVGRLTRTEVAAAIKLALVTIVLLPLVPDRTLSPADWPWLAERMADIGWSREEAAALLRLNPFRLWLLVAVISGLGFVGYVLTRALGPGAGLTLTGLVGGLASSTAVSVAMARDSRQEPEVRGPFVAAILAACAVMGVRVLLILLALSPALFLALLLPMTALLLASAVAAWWCARSAPATAAAALPLKTPFALLPALKLTALIFGVGFLSRVASRAFGDAGLLVTAFLSGIADVDPMTIIMGEQVAHGTLALKLASTAVLVAVGTNTLAKGLMVLALGSRAVGRMTLRWLLVTLAAAGLAQVAQLW